MLDDMFLAATDAYCEMSTLIVANGGHPFGESLKLRWTIPRPFSGHILSRSLDRVRISDVRYNRYGWTGANDVPVRSSTTSVCLPKRRY
jgi:hypothetical protein